jgi:hypothetical protein
MADQYTFQNLGQLSHTAGQIPFLYDKYNDHYRPIEKGDLGFEETRFDAFGRLRISEPFTLFDSSHRYADNGLWATATGGTGNATFNQNQGLMDLNISTGSGCYIYRETKKVFPYQPGKSLLSMCTFTMSPPQTNLVQRIGYFGSADGIFIEQSGSTLNLVKRTSVSGSTIEVKVPQSQWNGDTLNGTGYSQYTLDTTKSQILWNDMEWLGAGTIRMGFIIGGKFVLAHSFHHANQIEGTYLTTASLPLRYEIFNVGNLSTSGTLKQICSTVMSEGGYELRGSQRSIGTPITTGKSLADAGTAYPLVSLKLKSNRLDAIVIPSAVSALTVDTSICEWKLIKGATTLGGSWTSAGDDSSVEYNIGGTGISGGTVLAKGFISSSNQSTSQIDLPKGEVLRFQLERNSFTSTPTELTLAMAASTSSEIAYGSLDWEEVSR